MRKRIMLAVALLLVSALLLSACGVAQTDYDAVVAERDAVKGELETTKLLLATAQAIYKYHDVNVALADGYVSTEQCIQAPPGGMGIHYVNAKLMEAPVDPLKPPILLYLPMDKGMKLIGVEYAAVALASTPDGPKPWFKGEKEPPDSWVTTAPSVFGKTFDGPMAGHGPVGQEPWHYDQHVWLWGDNPSGLFVSFNPNLKCPSAPAQ